MTFIDTSNEEDLLTHEVSDETLEAAGGNEATNFSMSTCTYYYGIVVFAITTSTIALMLSVLGSNNASNAL